MKRLALLLVAALPLGTAFAQEDTGSTTEKLPAAATPAVGSSAPAAPASAAPAGTHESHTSGMEAGSGAGMSEPPAAQAAGTTPAADGKINVDAGEVTWAMPATWKSEPPANMMRKAQVRIPKAAGDTDDAEISISFFPGGGGGLEPNIQRWYGQFETADGKPVNDVAKRDTFKANGQDVTLVDISGTMKASTMAGMGAPVDRKSWRMLGGIVMTGAGPWFFKATGPDKTMAASLDAFKALLSSVKTK